MARPFLRFQPKELSMWLIRMSIKGRLEIGFDLVIGEPLRVSWNRIFGKKLYAFIPKPMDFFNQK
jgi:hypothetical protein